MINSSVELQAKMYEFDLGNYAREFWFKDGEGWDLFLASAAQKAELERKYHPTMSKKGFPETLIPLYAALQSRLPKVSPLLSGAGHPDEMSTSPEFLIAFNRNRLR